MALLLRPHDAGDGGRHHLCRLHEELLDIVGRDAAWDVVHTEDARAGFHHFCGRRAVHGRAGTLCRSGDGRRTSRHVDLEGRRHDLRWACVVRDQGAASRHRAWAMELESGRDDRAALVLDGVLGREHRRLGIDRTVVAVRHLEVEEELGEVFEAGRGARGVAVLPLEDLGRVDDALVVDAQRREVAVHRVADDDGVGVDEPEQVLLRLGHADLALVDHGDRDAVDVRLRVHHAVAFLGLVHDEVRHDAADHVLAVHGRHAAQRVRLALRGAVQRRRDAHLAIERHDLEVRGLGLLLRLDPAGLGRGREREVLLEVGVLLRELHESFPLRVRHAVVKRAIEQLEHHVLGDRRDLLESLLLRRHMHGPRRLHSDGRFLGGSVSRWRVAAALLRGARRRHRHAIRLRLGAHGACGQVRIAMSYGDVISSPITTRRCQDWWIIVNMPSHWLEILPRKSILLDTIHIVVSDPPPCVSQTPSARMRGMLRQRVLEVTQKATQSEALKRIAAGHQLLPADERGLQFLLFSAQGDHRKLRGYTLKPQVVGEERKKDFFDPFAKQNVEQDLFVSSVFGDHFLVLNKFSVVDEHVVLATVEFEEQETPLSVSDCRAVWKSMADLDAFAFFNCGYESGASQPHKHMQLISYPSMKTYCGQDMPPLLQFIDERLGGEPTDSVVHLPDLPFHHYLHRIALPPDVTDEEAASRLHAVYTTILKEMNACPYARRQGHGEGACEQPLAYNLLLTRSFIFVIPRKTPAHDGIEVNSIGFIGSFFERNDEQLAFFKTHGAMQLLQHVGFPPL